MDVQAKVDEAALKLRPTCTLDAINDTLNAAFGDYFQTVGHPLDPSSSVARYSEAIRLGFYDRDHQVLPARERETALIPLLAGQYAEDNLAIHVFIGLMAGLRAREVVDLVYLAGVYCGVNVLTRSLRVVTKTFDAVLTAAAAAGPRAPRDVLLEIGKRFPDAPFFAAARGELQKLAAL
jgi:alkylhydroperoxidase/carboxymuconolactone decarboxylase family protein YurZ